MNKNILDEEDELKGSTDAFLFQEAQFPSGRLHPFLVVSEIQRRKKMRDSYSAQEQQPQQTVSDQIIAEAAPQMPPQGIGALQPQAPQMPPDMMAAQTNPMAPQPQMMAAGGGRMPYRRMAGGGIVPPNSLVEDAAKFNPQTMYDMDASQMAMANPTNMGIASVLPMAAGGLVRMQEGEQLPFVSMDELPGGMNREKFQGLSPQEQDRYLQTIRERGAIVRGTKALLAPAAFLYDKAVMNPLKGVSELTGLGDYFSRLTSTKPTAFEGPQKYDEFTGKLKNWVGDTLSAEDARRYLSARPEISPPIDPRNEFVGPPPHDLLRS